MSSQLATTNPATIQAYFQKVQQLAATGDAFPVDLDEVWPLVYSEKGVAIRALRKNFFEGEDYTSFDQNVKREKGATVVRTYRLSTSCLEYFIARKVREVFEVYRAVFHQAVASLQAPTAPAIDPALLRILENQTQLMSSHQSQLDQLRADIHQLQAGGKVKRQAGRQLPLSLGSPLVDNRQTRQLINRRINEYCGLYDNPQHETYRHLYKRLYEIYGLNVYQLQRRAGESLLDAVERYGHLDRLLAVVTAELVLPHQ